MKIAKKFLIALLVLTYVLHAKTLVTVNGVAISDKDVYAELMRATQGRLNQVPADKQAIFREQVLKQLIAKELIYDDAKKQGILKSKEFEKEFKKVQQRLKKELAIQLWQKKLIDSIKVTDKELKNYYNSNKEEFVEKESVRARHIVVKTEKEAKEILKQLKGLSGDKLEKKFIELAKEKSTAPSAPEGGDLGYFTRGDMLPAFNDKVFSMKVGEVSEPVKTKYGYHVIYLKDKRSGKIGTFKSVKPFIEQRLKMEKFKTAMQRKMQELNKKATIK